MELLLATGNSHKKDEFKRILHRHKILIPQDIGIEYHAEETGSTYLENALIKARALFAHAQGRWVLADDSGLSVPALGGAPGIFSARYGINEAGRDLGSIGRYELLLKNMEDMTGEDRQAFFVCCMVLIADEYRIFTIQETFDGCIAASPAGSGGFGYDPVFYLPSMACTVAELDDREKDRLSHRGRAGQRMATLLENLKALP